MKKLDSYEDDRKGVVTYEFENGQRVTLDKSAVREYGISEVLRGMGLGRWLPTKRSVVMQDGLRVGTVPPDFDPTNINSKSVLYDARPGDFRREGDRWIASKSLGLGDLGAIPGFKPD